MIVAAKTTIIAKIQESTTAFFSFFCDLCRISAILALMSTLQESLKF